MDLVPTINIAEPSAASLSALDAACADHGFFLLEGHGLDDLIDQTWRATHQFFDSPPEVKESIRRNPDSMLGWFDRELTKRKRDHKEVFDFIDPEIPPEHNPNCWPQGVDGFRETMEQFFDAFAALASRTLELLHHTLGLPQEVAQSHTSMRSTSTVRLNYYPVGGSCSAARARRVEPTWRNCSRLSHRPWSAHPVAARRHWRTPSRIGQARLDRY